MTTNITSAVRNATSKMVLSLLIAFSMLSFVNVECKAEKKIEIAGRVVVAENGGLLPLEKASIYCIGTAIHSVSEANGTFKLSVPKNPKGIIISFVGYKPLMLSLDVLKSSKGKLNMADFVLTPDNTVDASGI